MTVSYTHLDVYKRQIVGVASCGGKHLEIWKIANLYRGEVVGQQALQPNTS